MTSDIVFSIFVLIGIIAIGYFSCTRPSSGASTQEPPQRFITGDTETYYINFGVQRQALIPVKDTLTGKEYFYVTQGALIEMPHKVPTEATTK
jgi:hypothetical protein